MRRVAGMWGVGVVVVAASAAQAQECVVTRLNQQLPDEAEVRGFGVLPDDSRRLAFLADGETVGKTDLYTVPIDGSRQPTLFDLEIPADRQTPGFPQFTSDGARAVYTADAETADTRELFSIATGDGGGNPVKISGPLVEDGDVEFDYRIAPDDTTVFYLADQEVVGRRELFRTSITGGPAVKVNRDVLGDGSVERDFIVSPDGQYVIYRAPQEQVDVPELYSAPVAGGMPVKLNAELDAGDEVAEFIVTPDSTRVIYISGQNADGTTEMQSVPIAGGTATPLHGDEAQAGTLRDMSLSPDGAWLVFRVRTSVSITSSSQIYSVPADGSSAPQRLNDDLPSSISSIDDYIISPDSQWLVFEGNQASSQIADLHSVPIGGGNVERLSALSEDSRRVSRFRITPDSGTVVYDADQETPFTDELFSVPIEGGMAKKLNPPLAADGDVDAFQIAPDGRTVVYTAEQETAGVLELFSVPTRGGLARKINGALVAGGEVGGPFTDFAIGPDGQYVAYMADQDTPDITELYRTEINCGVIFEDGFE